MITKECFQKLNLADKYEMLKKEGVFLASRIYQGFSVHLFSIEKFYVEVWKRISLDNIEWIEVVSHKNVNLYLDSIDINKLTEL